MNQQIRKDLSNKTMFINTVPASGWLNVLSRKSGKMVPILEYTRVQMIESIHGRTFFMIKDGAMKGLVASLSDANAKTYLGENAPKQTGVNVMVKYGGIEDIISRSRGEEINQQTATLSVNGLQMRVTLNSVRKQDLIKHTPLPPGLYRIRLPDSPHDKEKTDFYRQHEEPNLKYGQVWFPIEYGDNSRFIHVGHLSHGCVTVMQLGQWNALYKTLIQHRMSGSEYVGQILISK